MNDMFRDGLRPDTVTFARVVSVLVYSESKHPLPSYANLFDSGMDVKANLAEPVHLSAGKHAMIPTGLFVAVPQGLELQVRPRSGLFKKHRVSVGNTPGTIDAPYRGEICILLENRGDDPFTINDGDRIAQLVLAPVLQCAWEPVESKEHLGDTTRGVGGFGSTGSA